MVAGIVAPIVVAQVGDCILLAVGKLGMISKGNSVSFRTKAIVALTQVVLPVKFRHGLLSRL